MTAKEKADELVGKHLSNTFEIKSGIKNALITVNEVLSSLKRFNDPNYGFYTEVKNELNSRL